MTSQSTKIAPQARRAEIRPAHRPSLELLKSCGLKLSRGSDQLMGFGENMPLDVLFVRDDDIPDLVQEDVCDLGLVGRNVLEEKRLELMSRGHAADFQQIAHARLRPLPAVARGARRLQLRGPALARRQAHRDHLPVHARALAARTQRHGGHRHVVRRGRDRAAPRSRRRHLRPGLHRLDAAGESPAGSGNRAGEPGPADPHAGRAVAEPSRNGSTAC